MLTLACSLFATGAAQAAIRPADGVLSPRLAELAKPSVRSAPPAEQARKLGLAPEGPGSLLRDGNRVLVEAGFDRGAAAGVDDLRAAGAEIVAVSSRYQTVTAAVKPDGLTRFESVPGVEDVREVLAPLAAGAEPTCPAGAVVSQGVRQMRAGDGEGKGGVEEFEARKRFGVDGGGVTVGILSTSFDESEEASTHQGEDVESGDLPGAANTCTGEQSEVDNLTEDEEPVEEADDEGRAMAQIVHDVAPGAKLAFATAYTGEIAFAENIKRLLQSAGANVIADDVAYFGEPFFQEGPIADAVREVTEDGAAYFSAAGNDNLIDSGGHDVASWETPKFRDSGGCPPAVESIASLHSTHCLDFDPGPEVDRTFGIKVAPGATLRIDLQWAEPWFGVETDLDAFLLNSTGNLIAESAEDNVHGSRRPFEFIPWKNTSGSTQTVQLVVNRYSGGLPRIKFALLDSDHGVTGTEYPRSSGTDVVGPTVYGHAGSVDAIAVGAVPYYEGSTAEEYSSRGPVTHHFEPVDGSEPAEALAEPETLSKPDLAATDCGETTFFAQFFRFFPEEAKAWHFCGTSAAAPHAAGVAALMLDAEPATSAEIRSALQASAVQVGVFSPCAVGAGLVEAVGAIQDLGHAGSVEPDCSSPTAEVPVDEARAPGDWGLELPPPSQSAEGGSTEPSASTPPAARPVTAIRVHPERILRTRGRRAKAVFVFKSDADRVTFLCDIDTGAFHACPSRFVHRFAVGIHTVRVKARDANGAVGPTAVFRFRVKRVRHGGHAK